MLHRLRVLALSMLVLLTAAAPGSLKDPAVASEHGPRNVLLIVTDDQRLDGTMWALPAVQKWFGEGGTEFPNAYVTTPLCCPSRASILSGRYAHNHRVQHNGREARQQMDFDQTLPAFFKANGYRTGVFGKLFNKWPPEVPPPHFDRWVMSGAGYYNARFNFQGEIRRAQRYSTHVIARTASRFMNNSLDQDRPWFMYVAPYAAHAPFTPEYLYWQTPVPARVPNAAVGEEDRSDKPPWVQARTLRDPLRLDEVQSGQLRTLLSVNDLVDRLFTELDARGEADNTVAIFTSDNGFLWGEHGLTRKVHPYLESIKVPLYLRAPGHAAPNTVDDRLAANIDIAPTLVEAAGVQVEQTFDGMSLLQPTQRRSLFLEFVTSEVYENVLPSWDAVINGDHQYIVYRSPEGDQLFREYYDLDQDPAQLTNLLGDQDSSNDPPATTTEALDAEIEIGRNCAGSSCWMLP